MYEIFAHTADMGIRAKGDSLAELFTEAARGLFSVMMEDISTVRPIEKIDFYVQGDDLVELLHDWLAELLYAFHARRMALVEYDVQVDETELTASVRGEKIDPARHQIDVEVKAITWHELKIERQGEGWISEVIVDV